MSDSSSLDDLVLAAQGGRAEDLDRFLAVLRPIVCRWAVVWTGSLDIAEDVAQKVLIRVHRALGSYSPDASVSTWVYRITRNVVIDRNRARARQESVRSRVQLKEVATAVATDGGYRTFEAVELLAHLMEELSPQQRASLDLVELQGFSVAEASEMLEIAPSTVRVHIHRARATLRMKHGGEDSKEAQHG